MVEYRDTLDTYVSMVEYIEILLILCLYGGVYRDTLDTYVSMVEYIEILLIHMSLWWSI